MDWKARPRKYDLERRRLNHLNREEVSSHPLKITVSSKTSTNFKPDNLNLPKNHSSSKLSTHNKPEFEDPLSRFAAEASHQLNEEPKRRDSHDVLMNDLADHVTHLSTNGTTITKDDGFELWSQKQSQILSTFTTSQKLTLVALSNKKEVATKALPTSISEKVKTRLEQLDELEEGFEHETLSLTQEEYVNHINKLGSSLVDAWKDDQRVKTLKLAIQCSKLLGDTSSKQFYPSKFVIISEILDNFGRLVFERLLEKASPPGHKQLGSLVDIDPDMISDTAKETCRNWFYKIASIRELLPRIYIEASLLRCFDFLERGAAECALLKLTSATRGVAEPLVATYLRCYLARVGDSLSILRATERKVPLKKTALSGRSSIGQNTFPLACTKTNPVLYLLNSLSDTIVSLNSQPFCLELTNKIKYRDSESKILRCFVPGVEWIVRCLSRCVVTQSLTVDHFNLLFELVNQSRDHSLKSLIIGCLINQLPHYFIAERASAIKKIISELDVDDEEISDLYSRLGSSLAKGSDPPEEERRPLLNEVWSAITRFDKPRDYSTCAKAWSAFVARHFGKKEVNVVMGDVVRKLTPDRSFEAEQTSLRIVMGHFMNCSRLSLPELVALQYFLPFLDIMEGETKVLVCKDILTKYSGRVHKMRSGERSDDMFLTDPVVIHTFMTLCKYLHDQVSALTADEEVHLMGRLIADFVETVQKENESSQLQFYVECRSTFCNIDPVLMGLVHKVNKLATKERSAGGVMGRDATFLRACSAYCFITIPSLNGVFHKLNLYVVSGQVALRNGCLSQADSFFTSAIKLVVDVPRLLEMDGRAVHTEGMLLEFIRNLCSSLVVLPDPPDRPPLFHFKELLSKIDAYPWDQRFDSKVLSYCSILLSLSSESQSYLPYKVSGVDSNDTLYGSDPKFLKEVSKLSSEILSRIIEHLEALDGSKVAIAATSVIDQLLCHSDLVTCAPFFRDLWSRLGLGNNKEVLKGTTRKNSVDNNSVSVNVSKIVERVKQLATHQSQYDKFLSLMIS